ncbi:Long-chain-fatty-acid--CoA ligase [Brevundimonas sp. NIBR10]|uniref:acyl-CoA synthetase n=1 Tax=Brevundimonas sp. NIBR10 TaxID=3015997 RepID=UPI0022F17AB1|nr:acyl-CoA synthetase [Brevundimonas sp. NIBR10]WGM45902.1 Long-chain-fatty-acid--CoA ligase [Brevundimonas sp. NIBR10]
MSAVARLADIEALERTPLEARQLPDSTYAMIARGAALAPRAPALSFFLRTADHRRLTTLTHTALLRDITRAANLFRGLGIGRGDVVAFLLPNLPETHLTIWGGEAAGIVLAINPMLDVDQIVSLLDAARARVLVTLAPTPGSDIWNKAAQAAARVETLTHILAVDVSAYAHGPARWLVRARAAGRPGRIGRIEVRDFRRELGKQQGDALAFPAPVATDIASYFCTGGTTGLPKIARRTHGSEVFDAWAMALFTDGFKPGATIFAGLPLFHVNGQLVTGLAAFGAGAHVLIGTPQGYRGEGVIPRFWELVEHHSLSAFSGVPTVYAALGQQPVAGRDLSSLSFALCGAAPMPLQLFDAFRTQTGLDILEGYGLTEGACTSSINPPGGDKRIGSIGLRLPYQDMRVVVLDEAGRFVRDAAPEETGVLAIHGPNVFAGYLDPSHEAGLWIERQGRRWLNTGDLARQDADGYFWLTGRKKELIIRGGHNIDPKAIEDALMRHPAVALAAAVARPDPHAGEVPVAYVQLRPGQSADVEDLLAFARETIPERAAHPKTITIIDALPLTAVGKIFKPDLNAREIESVVRAEACEAAADLVSVAVTQDARRGLTATIEARSQADELRSRLAAYAFPADVTLAASPAAAAQERAL